MSKDLTNEKKICKYCKTEINKKAKKCPNCTKDLRNWFMRHKIISFILVLIFISAISRNPDDQMNKSLTTPTIGNTEQEQITKNTINTTPVTKPKDKIKSYGNGTYLVGKDIESGLYRVIINDSIMHMGYVERANDITMDLDSIIANIALTGDGYVEIKSTDTAVKLQGVKIHKVDISKLNKNIKNTVSNGIHLVGYDIEPGTYKVEVTDTTMNMGYVERAKSVAMGMDDIIANEVFQGPGYVKVMETDFAIKITGAKLTLQK